MPGMRCVVIPMRDREQNSRAVNIKNRYVDAHLISYGIPDDDCSLRGSIAANVMHDSPAGGTRYDVLFSVHERGRFSVATNNACMILLFWVSTILLALASIGGFYGPWRTAAPGAACILVVVDLIILGLHVFGGLR